MHTSNKVKNGEIVQQTPTEIATPSEVANGIGGVMKEGDVKVVVISQQVEANVEGVVALVWNGNIEEQM